MTCDCKESGRRACFRISDTIIAIGTPTARQAYKLRPVVTAVDSWWQIVVAAREAMHDVALSPLGALAVYNVCPMGLFSRFSLEAWKLYNVLGGLSRLTRPSDYYALPGVHLEAMQLIDGLVTQWKAERDGRRENSANHISG